MLKNYVSKYRWKKKVSFTENKNKTVIYYKVKKFINHKFIHLNKLKKNL